MYEEESFCRPAIQMEEWLTELGATPLVELGTLWGLGGAALACIR